MFSKIGECRVQTAKFLPSHEPEPFVREFEGGAFDEASARNYPTGEILERHLLLATDSRDEVVPTVAGLLLFGKNESVARLLPRVRVVYEPPGDASAKA